MALPAPNLDDRRFQDLVDDAKRLVQRHCPEWTDHNVSDPGVTMIELFAWMTDQLLYRLNRVPDRNYVKFLDLIGVKLFPPTAARAEVTYWLSAPQEETVRIPRTTQVATIRTETEEAITFESTEDLDIVPCELSRIASSIADDQVRDHTAALEAGQSFYCFDKVPKPGDVMLIGLSDAVPSCAVALRFDCQIEGVGVDPLRPPLVWEAWDGDGWRACDVDRDDTGGLNRPGDVVVHVHREHVASVINRQRAGWIRCRVVEAEEDQPQYSASPKINALRAFTIGGTSEALNAETIEEEIVGFSEGVPGQRFQLRRAPVVPSEEPRVLEVGLEGWQEWSEVTTFAESGPEDLHFMIDPVLGEVVLGPAVTEPDGTLRQYGAVPPKGAGVRMRAYRTGGGHRGNVARHALSVLKSSIPFVASVQNRHPARGGVDGEDIENAKVRGPILLHTGSRAVTAEDFEVLGRQAAPEVARVRCVPAGDGADAGGVRVLVVPAVADDRGRIRFEQLIPDEDTVKAIAEHLDERRVVGSRAVVEPPEYQGVTVVARLKARPKANPTRLQSAALEALYGYFHPITGGPDGNGWPYGRPVQAGEVYAVLQRLKGTEIVESSKLYAADPSTGERGKAVERIELNEHALVFSYEHQVLVEGA